MLSKESIVKSQEPKVIYKSVKISMKYCLLPFAFCLLPFISNAQCAMCRAALESEGNTAKAEGVNDGIVYLMIIPYLLVAAVGYYVYRMNKKKKADN